MRKIFAAMLALGLAGCMQHLPPAAYQPTETDISSHLPSEFFLKGKLAIGEVTVSKAPAYVTGEAYRAALQNIFAGAGLLSCDHSPYIVTAEIVDYGWHEEGFRQVTGRVTVAYALLDVKTGKPLYATRITTALEERKMLFQDFSPAMIKALSGALGNNAAQAAKQFAALSAKDAGAVKAKTPSKSKLKKSKRRKAKSAPLGNNAPAKNP